MGAGPIHYQQAGSSPGDLVKKGDVLGLDGYERRDAPVWEADASAKQYRANAAQERSRTSPTARPRPRSPTTRPTRPRPRSNCSPSASTRRRSGADRRRVLKGDLEDKSGQPVKQGDELMVVGRAGTAQGRDRGRRARHPGSEGRPAGWIATSSLPGDNTRSRSSASSRSASKGRRRTSSRSTATLQDTVGTCAPGHGGRGQGRGRASRLAGSDSTAHRIRRAAAVEVGLVRVRIADFRVRIEAAASGTLTPFEVI